MKFYWLLLGALGVWRITHLIQAEDGPADCIARLRQRAGQGFLGKLMDCFYCLSLWIALPFAFFLGDTPLEQGLLWPALSGAAILLEKFTSPSPPPSSALYIEHKENDHVMLRTTTDHAPGSSNPAPPT